MAEQPIPTKMTTVAIDQDKPLFPHLKHFTIVTVRLDVRKDDVREEHERAGEQKKKQPDEIRMAVVFDFMFQPEQLDRLGAFDHATADSEPDIRAVIVPFVLPISDPIKKAVDRFLKIRCIQLTDAKEGEPVADYYYNAPALGDVKVVNDSNLYASQIYKSIKKTSHEMLSNIAAKDYDNKYGTTTYGTKCYKDLEQDLVEEECKKARKTPQDVAIDLGCGTGRHSFLLGKYFGKVIGYYFSASMIEVAKGKKTDVADASATHTKPKDFEELRSRTGLKAAESISELKSIVKKVTFTRRDVERFPPDLPAGSVSFVCGSFGMGSYVEDLESLLTSCASLLRLGGRIFLSFYNKDAVHYLEPPPWRNNALAAQLDPNSHEMLVKLWEGTSFKVYCKSWNVEEVSARMGLRFNEPKVITSPQIAGVLPADYPAGADAILAKELSKIESIPRLPEHSKKGACQVDRKRFWWGHDSWWLPDQRRTP